VLHAGILRPSALAFGVIGLPEAPVTATYG
jgi:hypothetical protein